MKRLVVLLLGLLPVLSACVQTGDARWRPDYAEAARINTRLGMDYLAQGRVELAQQKFEKALRQSDDLAETHLGLALVHQRFDEDEQARKYFKRALSLAPKDTMVLTYYASYLCGQGELSRAEGYFTKALADKRNPNVLSSYTEAGACYQSQQQTAKAEESLRQALSLNPRYAPALLKMSSISAQREDFLRARGFLQRYEEVQESSAEALLLGLQIEAALGSTDTAQTYAVRLKQLIPNIGSQYDLQTGKAW